MTDLLIGFGRELERRLEEIQALLLIWTARKAKADGRFS
jgi:hypothetical protein